MSNIEALNAKPIAVSVQDKESHKKFRAENKINFPNLSDENREVATRYGVLTGPGGVAKRHTFYIDPAGVVRKVDEKVQPFSAAKDVIANLKEIQKAEPKPSLANSRQWDQKINALRAELRKNPDNKEASVDLATALYLKGRYTMLDTWLSADLRYPAALSLFNEALKLNPNLIAAQEDKAKIEEINRKTNRTATSG